MILTATKGKTFTEDFTFKTEDGQLAAVPFGKYVVTVARGSFVSEYPAQQLRSGVRWNLSAEQTQEFEYSSLSFVLTFNEQEIARGILRVV